MPCMDGCHTCVSRCCFAHMRHLGVEVGSGSLFWCAKLNGPFAVRWPAYGAARACARDGVMWKTCDTWGMLVFLHALWHSWLLRCVVLRVVTLLRVMLCRVGNLAGCVVLCGSMSWLVLSSLVATRGVMPWCVTSLCAWWVFWFVIWCSFRVALYSAVPCGVVSRCVLARRAGVRRVRWCRPVALLCGVIPWGYWLVMLCLVVTCSVLWCSVVLCCAEGAVTKGQKAGMSTHG